MKDVYYSLFGGSLGLNELTGGDIQGGSRGLVGLLAFVTLLFASSVAEGVEAGLPVESAAQFGSASLYRQAAEPGNTSALGGRFSDYQIREVLGAVVGPPPSNHFEQSFSAGGFAGWAQNFASFTESWNSHRGQLTDAPREAAIVPHQPFYGQNLNGTWQVTEGDVYLRQITAANSSRPVAAEVQIFPNAGLFYKFPSVGGSVGAYFPLVLPTWNQALVNLARAAQQVGGAAKNLLLTAEGAGEEVVSRGRPIIPGNYTSALPGPWSGAFRFPTAAPAMGNAVALYNPPAPQGYLTPQAIFAVLVALGVRRFAARAATEKVAGPAAAAAAAVEGPRRREGSTGGFGVGARVLAEGSGAIAGLADGALNAVAAATGAVANAAGNVLNAAEGAVGMAGTGAPRPKVALKTKARSPGRAAVRPGGLREAERERIEGEKAVTDRVARIIEARDRARTECVDNRCRCLTLAGTRCKNTAVRGGFCTKHQGCERIARR
jgi:hypothetical protein